MRTYKYFYLKYFPSNHLPFDNNAKEHYFFRFIIKLFTIQESAVFPLPTTRKILNFVVLWVSVHGYYAHSFPLSFDLRRHLLSLKSFTCYIIVSRSHSTYPIIFWECIRLTVLICLQIRLDDASTHTPLNYVGL